MKIEGEDEEEGYNSDGTEVEKKPSETSLMGGGGGGGLCGSTSSTAMFGAGSADAAAVVMGAMSPGEGMVEVPGGGGGGGGMLEVPASVDAVLEEDEIGASADELEHFLMLKDLGSPLTKNKLKLILAREMEYERILKLPNGNYVQNPNAPVKKRLKDKMEDGGSPQKIGDISGGYSPATTPEANVFRALPPYNNINMINNNSSNAARMITVPATATIIPAVKNADGTSAAAVAASVKPAYPPNYNNNGGTFVAATPSSSTSSAPSSMTPQTMPVPVDISVSSRGPIVTYEKTRTSTSGLKPISANDLSACVMTVPVALNRVGGMAAAAHGLAVNLSAAQTSQLHQSTTLSSGSSSASLSPSVAGGNSPAGAGFVCAPTGYGKKRPNSLDVVEASSSSTAAAAAAAAAAEMAKRIKTDPSSIALPIPHHQFTALPPNAFVHATAAGLVASPAGATPGNAAGALNHRFIGHPIPLSIPFSFANSMTSNLSPTTVIIASPHAAPAPASPMMMTTTTTTTRDTSDAASSGGVDPHHLPAPSPTLKCDYCLSTAAANKEGEPEALLSCKDCGARAHPSCMDFSRELAIKAREGPWQCIDCKTCRVCSDPARADPLLVCEACDKAYHKSCHFPPIPVEKPVGKWVCQCCVADLDASLITRAEDETGVEGGGGGGGAISGAAADAESCFGWIDGEGRFVTTTAATTATSSSSAGAGVVDVVDVVDPQQQPPFHSDNNSNLHLQYPPGNDLGPVHPATYVQAQWSIFKSYREFLDVPPAKLEETPDARSWSADEVFSYLRSQGFADADAKVFVDHDIDGRAALLLKRQDVISSLGLKLGPAIKLYRQIQVLQLKYKEVEAI